MKQETDIDPSEREKIRQIWRPLYDLGYRGAEQIDAQYMAMLISAAVDETQALITSEKRKLIKEILGDLPGEWSAETQMASPWELQLHNDPIDEITKLLERKLRGLK